MDSNSPTVQFLSQSFLDALSPQHELRRRAEENLSAAADTPKYGLAVLRLVAEPSVDEQIRQCAAVNFKNHLKNRWAPSSATPIPDGEKEKIKTLVVPLMVSATGKIQTELSEAISVIGNHDFPGFWPALLPDLKSSLETALNANDFASVSGILATVNYLFKRFRCECSFLYKRVRREFKINPILLDLEYCLDNFAAPLLSTVESISRKINAVVAIRSVATLRQLLEARRLCCRIFYSLIYLDVREELEDKEDEWMNEFRSYLTERYPAIEDSGDADCLAIVDQVRAAVCENIIHYMEKKEDFSQKHLSDFAEAVWSLLVVASSASERLTTTGMKFLRIVSNHDEMLQRIVIPNVMLQDEDKELFQKNCLEFIRRDMEGNELNTRRRLACEILKGKDKKKISEQIQHCLALFAENPAANWKYKEGAIYLVVSLATGNGASVSTDVVDVESFFRSVIVPELQGQEDMNAFPMLKAGALKFFTVFHVLIPKHVAMPLVGDLVRYVGSDVKVVHSYAAICIEKLLLVKDMNNGGGILQRRYTSIDIHPFHKDLISKLCYALRKCQFLEGNHYIMRCIMRVCQIADISWTSCVASCMTELTMALGWICCGNYPKTTPVYNRFLFEAIATLVRRSSEKDPCVVTTLQTRILSIFKEVLFVAEELTELFPYALQLLAQVVDLNRPPSVPFPQIYMQTFDGMLKGPYLKLWEKPENVMALTRLLESLLQQAPDEVNKEGTGRLRRVVVGVIYKLLSSPTTEEEGFHLLNIVIDKYAYGVIAEYMNDIWASLYTRLQSENSKTSARLVRYVIIFMSLFLVKHGVQTLVDLINDSVVVNSFHVFLREFWIPNLKCISTSNNYTEVKLLTVASTKVLYESASLLDYAAEELWGKLLDAIVTLLSLPLPPERVDLHDADDDEGPDLTLLENTGGKRKKEDWDPLKEIKDPKHYLVAFPENLTSEYHGIFPQVSMTYLSPHNKDALVKLCRSYGIDVL